MPVSHSPSWQPCPLLPPRDAESHSPLLVLLVFLSILLYLLLLLFLQVWQHGTGLLDRWLQQGHLGPLLRAGVRAGTGCNIGCVQMQAKRNSEALCSQNVEENCR